MDDTLVDYDFSFRLLHSHRGAAGGLDMLDIKGALRNRKVYKYAKDFAWIGGSTDIQRSKAVLPSSQVVHFLFRPLAQEMFFSLWFNNMPGSIYL